MAGATPASATNFMQVVLELSAEQALFLRQALVHSTNVHVTFCNQGAEEYPVDKTLERVAVTEMLLSKFPPLSCLQEVANLTA